VAELTATGAVGDAGHRRGAVERRIPDRGDRGRPPGVVGEVHDRQAVEVGHDEPLVVERHPLALADGRALDPGDRPTARSPRVEVDAVEGAVGLVDDQEPPVGHRDDAREVVRRRRERDLRGDRQRGRAPAALGDLLRGEVPEHRTGPVGGPDVAGARHDEVEDLPSRSGLEAAHLRFVARSYTRICPEIDPVV
jgi:hypothetical protein